MSIIKFLRPLSRYGLIFSAFGFTGLAMPAESVPGVSPSEIVVGTSTNLRGATAGVAVEFNEGITAYINKINKQGGIYGRKIRRIIYNDSYEPDLTYAETKKLINDDKVFMLVGYASTPGVKRILPLVESKKIPVIAPYSGTGDLRTGKQRNIFNIKAGYLDQTESLAKLAVYSLGINHLCVFYQDDALGNEVRDGADRMLKKYTLKIFAQSSYQRNSMDIQPALKALRTAGCKGIIMASQDRQASAFIRQANASGFHPLYFCLNLIGTQQFLKSVEALNEKVFVAVVTPLPSETAYPIVREFRKEISLLNHIANVTANTLEGYLSGAVLEEVLKRAGKNLTRATLATAFESLKDTNIGGVNFTFNKANRQATNRVLIAKAEGGELVLLP